ncbi:alpha-beta hydrolase superfamily lysophospholipase [Erwinia toletana]|uniref:Alpha-beta hydrolase superfamily lysophospholipase n=1 Tax=Winslowiella toletana TaxID=92490 RepID=A0ABS4P9R5_9GAMM|nr:alpha/beta hydrolase [Winslowiella toletana]MBP2168865.1 alpha-beta hydrolase superfamily lysophospholipase [Winslowiella toletana]
MLKQTKTWLKRATILFVLLAIALLAIRITLTERGPELALWHTWVPDELSESEIDKADWASWTDNENRVFAEVKANVTDKLSDQQPETLNRYAAKSPVYPASFTHNWNHSYILLPPGKPRGAVVLLHGLTDSPYSLRHFARNYQQQGFVAVAIRLPGHGTVPGALTRIDWEEWMAATRLAVREARKRIPAEAPLHIMGFSNGGALAMKYALDALDNPQLPAPQRLVLISPMIGVSGYARYAGLAGLPSLLPAFARTAWLSILPEFNPFKYNSFPVKAARQSYLLTRALQKEIIDDSHNNKLGRLAPVLTFQSVADATVSTPAVINALYNQLPDNGSELVLFDVNQSRQLSPMISSSAQHASEHLLPAAPRHYATTLVTSSSPQNRAAVARRTPADATTTEVQPLGIDYPADIYSLSHVALPFPFSDSLYGRTPEKPNEFGVSLGSLTPRGERSVLIVSLDMLMRISSNPFYPWMLQRINQTLN